MFLTDFSLLLLCPVNATTVFALLTGFGAGQSDFRTDERQALSFFNSSRLSREMLLPLGMYISIFKLPGAGVFSCPSFTICAVTVIILGKVLIFSTTQ